MSLSQHKGMLQFTGPRLVGLCLVRSAFTTQPDNFLRTENAVSSCPYLEHPTPWMLEALTEIGGRSQMHCYSLISAFSLQSAAPVETRERRDESVILAWQLKTVNAFGPDEPTSSPSAKQCQFVHYLPTFETEAHVSTIALPFNQTRTRTLATRAVSSGIASAGRLLRTKSRSWHQLCTTTKSAGYPSTPAPHSMTPYNVRALVSHLIRGPRAWARSAPHLALSGVCSALEVRTHQTARRTSLALARCTVRFDPPLPRLSTPHSPPCAMTLTILDSTSRPPIPI
ncbi:hypothetical protein LZ30DRAFT_52305 [Colletotrichum cereale]|nr:hypothetical protein LZ30DRAFT_52305 [Colletotrichum cereale]